MPGGFLALSADATKPGTAILWALMPLTGNANAQVVHGVLRAFDPVNFITRPDGSRRIRQLWSSDHDDDRSEDSLGMYPKFSTPTIANGHVMVTTFRELYRIPFYAAQLVICPMFIGENHFRMRHKTGDCLQ
jgi:hypothetical protein